MWLLTVASLRYSLPAISAFDRPWATSRTTQEVCAYAAVVEVLVATAAMVKFAKHRQRPAASEEMDETLSPRRAPADCFGTRDRFVRGHDVDDAGRGARSNQRRVTSVCWWSIREFRTPQIRCSPR
jgi:hypothetical protein